MTARGFLSERDDRHELEDERELVDRDDFEVMLEPVRAGDKARAHLFMAESREIWVPLALIRKRQSVPGTTFERVTLPMWFAQREGLT